MRIGNTTDEGGIINGNSYRQGLKGAGAQTCRPAHRIRSRRTREVLRPLPNTMSEASIRSPRILDTAKHASV